MAKRKRTSSPFPFPTKKLIRSYPVQALIFFVGVLLGHQFDLSQWGLFPKVPLLVQPNEVAVCFTPNIKCKSLILSHLAASKTTIHLQGYSFTDGDIAQELIAAQREEFRSKFYSTSAI